MDKNDEKEKESIFYWVCRTKADPDNYEIVIDLKWSDLQEEKIA